MEKCHGAQPNQGMGSDAKFPIGKKPSLFLKQHRVGVTGTR